MGAVSSAYEVLAFPKMRRMVIDGGRMGRRRHMVHGLLEMDVTAARRRIRRHRASSGESLSFTAFFLSCLAEAVDSDKAVQAYLNWRGKLVIFDDVDVMTLIEVDQDGLKVALPHIIRAANKKSFLDIHREIRTLQHAPQGGRHTQRSQFIERFLSMPGFVRDIINRAFAKSPHRWKGMAGTVSLSSVGMFGQGGGWGLAVPNHALSVLLGGIAEKPGVVDGRIEIREYLSVTLSFDHDVIDGAPAARFTQRLKELVECGHGLPEAKGTVRGHPVPSWDYSTEASSIAS